MSKKKPEKEFKCPGCQELFDTAMHIPFIGSCGDSMCGDCVNEKKIKVCPMCNQRSFSWKQLNNLATELLIAMDEREIVGSMKSKFDAREESYANQPVPALLASKIRPVLAKIANQLDPKSFLKLSSTCKYLHNYCFESKDIKIEYEISSMSVKYHQHGFFGFQLESEYEKSSVSRYRPSDYVGYGCGFLGSAVNRKKLRNYPVTFRIKDFHFKANVFSEFIAKTRSFFEEFPIQAISNVSAAQNINDWSGFVQFLQDFHVGEVRIYAADWRMFGISPPPTMPEEAAIYLLHNTVYLNSDYHIPENLVRNASVPNLHLGKTLISKDTFLNLIEKFANSTKDINWRLCYDGSFGHYDLFRSLSVDYKGPIPEERPHAFTIDDHPEIFWILRKDGKYLRCWSAKTWAIHIIEILTTPDHEVPNGLFEMDRYVREYVWDSDSDDSDFM